MDLSDRLSAAVISRYRVGRELGRGGMAIVYIADDLRHGRQVALKVLQPDVARALGADRFLREIELTARLDHPHILPLLDSGDADGFLYYVMPFVEGESLRDRLNREKQLPLADALRIGGEIADALGYAHSLGVVHRDIKPANILLSRGHARVADFGIARAVTEAGGVHLTETGLSVGTPAYMSPEQASGEHDLDGRSDLYSLGCVLYEMLAGEPPHTGPTPQAILAKRLGGPVPRVVVLRETVPPSVDQAIATALAKAPADRFQTAQQFLRALGSEAQGLSDSPALESPVPEHEGALGDARAAHGAGAVRSVRRRVITGAIGVGVLLVLAAGSYLTAFKGPRVATPVITSHRPVTNLRGLETSPSWSPDGTRFAYVSDETGNLDIWVHQVAGRGNANITQAHEGDDWHPAWSPDGQWIAFLSDAEGGGVDLVPAIGGSPDRIWEAAGGLDFESGLAWSPDGSRLALSIGPALYLVPPQGGEAQEVVLPAEIVRFKTIDVSWSPSGDRITFVARAAAWLSTSAIWSVRPDGSDPVRVTGGNSFDRHPVWVQEGDGIYFVSDRGGSPDLWYLPVDARGRPRGEPAALTVGAGVGTFAVSRDGRRVAYSNQIERSNIWSMRIGDYPMTIDDARPVTDENHFVELLALSPDGKRIAFDSDRSGNADIWTIGVGGTGLRQITTDSAHEWAPRWTPDGESIGYHSLKTGNRDLWVQPVRGGTPVQLTDDPAQDWTISWSPDGKTIVFGSGRSGAVQLWRMAATGGEATQLTTIGAVWWYPVWSPDGKTLAFSSDTSGYAEIYLVSVDGGDARQLTNNGWQKGFPIALSADGGTLYACGNTRPGLERLDVWAIALADGSTRQLTDFSGTRLELFNATTDGHHIYAVFLERVGDLRIAEVTSERS